MYCLLTEEKSSCFKCTEAPISDDESDADDDFNSCATCMMVFTQPNPELNLSDSEEYSTDDEQPGLPFIRRTPVFRASNFLLENSLQSNSINEGDQDSDQIEFEQRMLKRFNPKRSDCSSENRCFTHS